MDSAAVSADDLLKFGSNLKRAREARSLSQSALADLANVHQVAVARIELGRREPGVRTVARLARALGVSAAELFEDIDGR